MDINVFKKYKVKLHNKYSYISDYDYEMKESIFSENVEEWEKVMSGGELMEFIGKLLLEDDVISITEQSHTNKQLNIICIEKYQVNGTGATISITSCID